MHSIPFLVRFAQTASSPRSNTPSPNYYYDETAQLVRWKGSPEHPPAVLMADDDDDGPTTKKADVEKGEDMKDGRMW